MDRKKILILSALAIVAVLGTVCAVLIPGSGKAEDVRPKIHLNEKLSNELSELPETEGLDRKVRSYMRKWHLKGASLAIMRNDSLVYAKGYGWADEEEGVEMEPSHILRLASVSKLITAVGIMVLQDRGVLNIKDPVFGPQGILTDSLFTSVIKDKNYSLISVEHLLRHQGGFYRDPLFSSRDVMNQMRLDHPPTKEDFFRLVLGRKLRHKPGERDRYSNFGYLLLSEIIEKASGKPYEQFIREDVLEPAGCFDMHIAGIYYKDRRENEVRYYTHEGKGKFIEEYTNNDNMVERCYGGSDIPVLSGAGAWCGSPAELARLVASIDGRDEVDDIISAEAVRQMTEYLGPSVFSLGWNDTNPASGWSRSGTLAGTCALVKYFPDGECWIMVTNTSTWKGPRQARYTSGFFTQCRQAYSSKLPARDLFQTSPIQTSPISE